VDSLRRPHASIHRSPRIAEPLFLARYIEKAGTGTLDMISQCAQAGLPAPEFRQDGGQFVQTLWRAKAATEFVEVAERSNRTKFRDQVIKPLLEQGLLEMTLPEKPTSSQQKYRLTARGAVWLANQTETGNKK
jgi:ATP-dependent DNA helicase RecG